MDALWTATRVLLNTESLSLPRCLDIADMLLGLVLSYPREVLDPMLQEEQLPRIATEVI